MDMKLRFCCYKNVWKHFKYAMNDESIFPDSHETENVTMNAFRHLTITNVFPNQSLDSPQIAFLQLVFAAAEINPHAFTSVRMKKQKKSILPYQFCLLSGIGKHIYTRKPGDGISLTSHHHKLNTIRRVLYATRVVAAGAQRTFRCTNTTYTTEYTI